MHKIAGFRKSFYHRYTEFGKIAMQVRDHLIERKLILRFSPDTIEGGVRRDKAGQVRRVVAFVKEGATGFALEIYLEPYQSTWLPYLVELKAHSDGTTKTFCPIAQGDWAEVSS